MRYSPCLGHGMHRSLAIGVLFALSIVGAPAYAFNNLVPHYPAPKAPSPEKAPASAVALVREGVAAREARAAARNAA